MRSKSIENKQALPQAFSVMKVAENTGAMVTMYAAGYIKQETGSYVGVHALFALITLVATALAYHNWLRAMKEPLVEKGSGGLTEDSDDEAKSL